MNAPDPPLFELADGSVCTSVTLRDLFAGLIMAGIRAAEATKEDALDDDALMANEAYAAADALLAERSAAGPVSATE